MSPRPSARAARRSDRPTCSSRHPAIAVIACAVLDLGEVGDRAHAPRGCCDQQSASGCRATRGPSTLTVTLSKNASTGWRKRGERQHGVVEIFALRSAPAMSPADVISRDEQRLLLLGLAQRWPSTAGRRRRGRPASPRCARCCGAPVARSAGWRRPRCRGSASSASTGRAAAPDRLRRQRRTPRDQVVPHALSRRCTFSRSAKKSSSSSSRHRRRCLPAARHSPQRLRERCRSGSRSRFSRISRMTPSAARRSANGILGAGRLLADREEAGEACRACRRAPRRR